MSLFSGHTSTDGRAGSLATAFALAVLSFGSSAEAQVAKAGGAPKGGAPTADKIDSAKGGAAAEAPVVLKPTKIIDEPTKGIVQVMVPSNSPEHTELGRRALDMAVKIQAGFEGELGIKLKDGPIRINLLSIEEGQKFFGTDKPTGKFKVAHTHENGWALEVSMCIGDSGNARMVETYLPGFLGNLCASSVSQTTTSIVFLEAGAVFGRAFWEVSKEAPRGDPKNPVKFAGWTESEPVRDAIKAAAGAEGSSNFLVLLGAKKDEQLPSGVKPADARTIAPGQLVAIVAGVSSPKGRISIIRELGTASGKSNDDPVPAVQLVSASGAVAKIVRDDPAAKKAMAGVKLPPKPAKPDQGPFGKADKTGDGFANAAFVAGYADLIVTSVVNGGSPQLAQK